MNIRIIQNESDFISIKESWNAIASEPLQSWEWNYWWWKHLAQHNPLRIFAAYQKGIVRGIAPFFVESRHGEKCLRFLGSGKTCTDYLQIIAQDEIKIEFCFAIANEIQNNLDRVSLVELEGVAGTDYDQLFCERLNDSFWRYDQQLASTWVVDLPKTWDEFAAGRHKSLRRKIRKAEKRYKSGQANVESTRDELGFEEAFDLLAELHQKRFVSKGKRGVFSDARFKDFLKNATRALSEKGHAEIIVCRVDGQPIVAHLYLNGSNGPQMYQSGICDQSMHLEPGHLLFTHTVHRAIDEGHSTFDFLRGDEHYKSLWGGAPIPLYTIRCVSNRFYSTMTHQVIRGLRGIKRALKDRSPIESQHGAAAL